MKSRSLIWGCICGVVGGAALSLVGLLLFTSSATNDSPNLSQSGSTTSASTDDQPLDLSKLNENSDITSLIDHGLELIQFFETATFDEILELFSQTGDASSNFRTWYIQESLIEQLASIDPLATLDTVQSLSASRRHQLLPVVYSTWASRDPQEAMKHAAQQPKFSKLRLVRAIVSNLPTPLSSELKELSESLEIDEIVSTVLAEVAARELMQSSPQAAFDLIFSDNVDDVEQESLLLEVIGTWMTEPTEEDFKLLFSSFREQYAQYAQIDRINSRTNLMLYNVLDQIVQVDPHRIWRLNLSTASESQSSLNFHILLNWGSLDPRSALEAIAEIEGSELYDESYRTVWRMWSELDPVYVLQNIQQVQPEFRPNLISTSVLHLVRQENVDQAISSIVQMKDQGENIGSAVRTLANAWVGYDASSATDWLVTSDTINDTLRKDVLKNVLPALSNTDPLRAYQLAVEFGDPEAFDPRFTLEMRVLDSVAKRGDFESAIGLLQEVDDSLMVTARSTIGQSLISFGEVAEAIALGAELADADQTQYFQNLAILWFQSRPDELFENLVNLPTVESQQAVAATLLQDWLDYRAEMSRDEIALLEDLVAEIESP